MKKLYDYICKAEVYISMWALAILTVLVTAAAIARSMSMPIIWAIDAATFLFAWCVFLAADIAMRRDRLFSIEVLTCRLSRKHQHYLKITNNVIIVVFLACLIVYGLQLSYDTRLRTFQGMPGVSYTWVTLSVPVGCLLMAITAILKVRDLLRNGYENTQGESCGVTKEII